jgi:hypothetical protein
MDQEALVDRDIEEGRRLVQALDLAGFPVIAAFWSFLPEEGDWRLLIASPNVREQGPRKTYKAIQDVRLQSNIPISLHRVTVVDPDEALVADLRIFAGTDPAPFIGSTYLQKAVIGNTYIERVYIYRAKRIVGQSGAFELWSVIPDRERKVWKARHAKVTFENGFFKKIEIEGVDSPQTHTKTGINAHLAVLINAKEQDGAISGDVQRWTILGGRLRSVETVAHGVRIEGYSVASS